MIIYKDFLTHDELFSDAYTIEKKGDFIWEVEGQMVQVKGGVDDALIGGNPSAEGGAREVDDDIQTVINIVHAYGLEEIPFGSLSDYKNALKSYLGSLKQRIEKKNPEKKNEFMQSVQTYWKDNIFKNFKDWQFFRAPNYDAELQYYIPVNFREDGMTPYFVFIVDGLDQEKF